MKNRFLSTLTLMLVFVASLVAQPSQKPQGGLSEDQKAKIKELKISHYKEINPLRNKMMELRVRQHSLVTAEKADMAAINANIDEMTKLQNQIAKSNAAHQQQVRGLLTDEQRMAFDRKMARSMMKEGQKMQKGKKDGKRQMKGGMKAHGQKQHSEVDAPSEPAAM